MRAVLRIEVRDGAGCLLAARESHNAVMRGGAQLLADLFSGKGKGITHMAVGTSDAPEPDDFSTAALTNAAVGDVAPLTGATEATIPAEAFASEADPVRRVVKVRVRGTMPPNAAIGTVREAGLISRAGDAAVLYNRVTFAPIVKGNDHELT